MTIRVPKELVFLGWVLDATLEREGKIIKVNDDWYGWFMATVPGAEHMPEGRARIYLLSSDSYFAKNKPVTEKAADTFREWTTNEPQEVFQTEAPDDFGHVQGRMVRLGYKSDKWEKRGQYHDYEHNFTEDDGVAPIVRTDTADIRESKGAVMQGGTMRVTAQGIA